MNYRKTKWFVYTVLVGLIPFLARMMIFLFSSDKVASSLINECDFVLWGLILNIASINELEHLDFANLKPWKTFQNGVSIMFIVMYGVIFAVSIISVQNPQLFDTNRIQLGAVILGLASLLSGYSVADRLSKLPQNGASVQ